MHSKYSIIFRFIKTTQNSESFYKLHYLIISIFILLIFCLELSAQPGGGGGLYIKNIYDRDLKLLNERDEFKKNVQIRTFLLNNHKISIERHSIPKSGRNYHSQYAVNMPHPSYQERKGEICSVSEQRLIIIYKKDTMVVDFIGIMGENGMGNIDEMDSLVILKGKYIYNRGFLRKGRIENYKDISFYLKRGLTPHSTEVLKAEGIIEYRKLNKSDLPSEKNLDADYFFNRARFNLQQKDSIEAFKDLKKVVELLNQKTDCPSLQLLTKSFIVLREYPNAIEAISKAINCNPDIHLEVGTENNYRQRAELYIKTKNFTRALEDYNRLVKISEDGLSANIERAEFKIKYLNDPSSAISDLRKEIDNIPIDHLSGNPQGKSEYTSTYFCLANAYYSNNNDSLAFRYWLKAMEHAHENHTSSDLLVVHFDSLIKIHKSVPELYFAQAIAIAQRAPYQGWGEETKKSFTAAVEHLKIAENLGMTDFKLNMYKASYLSQLKKFDEAMVEIEKAIQKNNKDPRCVIVRYSIRKDMGKVIWGNKNDPDYLLINELNKNWIFEKY